MAAKALSYIPIVGRLVDPVAKGRAIKLPPVETYNIETDPARRARCLKHLIKANHVNHSILYHDLQFDNHTPHILCSAYLFGASEDKMHDIYDKESRELEPWKPSPAEIVEDDWRDFLGDRQYQRAYIDFFEDQLVMHHSYDWKKLVHRFLFEGKQPLGTGLIGGLGHPLIHLGYAFEMNCKEIAIEGLGLAATQNNYLQKYTADPAYTKPAPFQSTSPIELLNKLAGDKRFDGLFKSPGYQNIDRLFDKHEDLVLEYWNAWTLEDPLKQFRESQEAAAALLVATVPPGTRAYNFFVVHLLTTSHAVRILLPFSPPEFHIPLVRQWWLLTLAVYIARLRPKVDPDYVDPSFLKGRGWSFVEDQAINSPWSTDAHFVKALRALREAARTWGDVQERYLASAVTFIDNFHGWTF